MMDPVLAAITALRQDVSEMRADLSATREDTARLAEAAAAGRRDLDLHRADDLRVQGDHEQQLRSLGRWRWTTAGAVAVLTLLLTVGTPVLLAVT